MTLVRLLDRALRLAGIAILSAMMVLTFADVVGREVFARPLSAAPELTVLGLAALVYVGLPRISAREEHISIGLLDGLFKGRAHDLRMTFVSLLACAICTVLAREVWRHGDELGAEVMILLDFRKALLAYLAAIMSGITALVFLVRAAVHLRAALRRQRGA